MKRAQHLLQWQRVSKEILRLGCPARNALDDLLLESTQTAVWPAVGGTVAAGAAATACSRIDVVVGGVVVGGSAGSPELAGKQKQKL